ncbi:hypothetical protein QE412_000395 [Microbacterium trichothecenolyticum]|uniref:Uncharacterized protein n=1 Tax=Microbacterium trichothecenolyticum TaxID=69370 RepID=A0ABU0TQ82_MICTR|nr:hypothetical protein [Microbacterium trichothecenolyticum]
MDKWVLPANRPEVWAVRIAEITASAQTYARACREAQTLLIALNNIALDRVAELRDAIYS